MLQCDIWSRYFISSSLSPRHLAEVFAARLLHFLFCLPCLSSFCFVLIHFLPFPSFSSFFAHHPSDPKSLQIPYFLSSNLYSCIHPPPSLPPPPSTHTLTFTHTLYTAGCVCDCTSVLPAFDWSRLAAILLGFLKSIDIQ